MLVFISFLNNNANNYICFLLNNKERMQEMLNKLSSLINFKFIIQGKEMVTLTIRVTYLNQLIR